MMHRQAWGPWPALILALVSIILATIFRHFSVTAALLCLLAINVVAQALGVRAGMLMMALCSCLLAWIVVPLNPYLISTVSNSDSRLHQSFPTGIHYRRI